MDGPDGPQLTQQVAPTSTLRGSMTDRVERSHREDPRHVCRTEPRDATDDVTWDH